MSSSSVGTTRGLGGRGAGDPAGPAPDGQGVGGRVEFESEEAQQADDAGAHGDSVLADAPRENERVEAAEGHDQASELFGGDVGEHLDGQRRARIAGGGVVFQRPQIVGVPGDAQEAGAFVQHIEDPIGALARRAGDVADQRRIHAAGARPHHQPLERGQPHGGVDAAPVEDRRRRAPVAEVCGHERAGVRGQAEEVLRFARHIAVARPVEPVPTHAVGLAPLERHGVGVRAGRHRLVEGRVEDGDLRQRRQKFAGDANALQIRGVVQGAEGDAGLDLTHDLGGDAHRPAEPRAAVNDAVTDAAERPGETAGREQGDRGPERAVVIGAGEGTGVFFIGEGPLEGGLRAAEALRLTDEVARARARIEHGKLGRGTAAVEDENVHGTPDPRERHFVRCTIGTIGENVEWLKTCDCQRSNALCNRGDVPTVAPGAAALDPPGGRLDNPRPMIPTALTGARHVG